MRRSKFTDEPMIASLLMLIAVALFACSAARAGQPLFGRLLED